MAYNNSLNLLLTISLMAFVAVARPLSSGQSLATRLNLDTPHEYNCWDSLFQLQSCTSEVVLFFLNQETTRLGPNCCHAIHVVEHDCWPAMLTSIGFTAEEGDILEGYCDASEEQKQYPSSSTDHVPHSTTESEKLAP